MKRCFLLFAVIVVFSWQKVLSRDQHVLTRKRRPATSPHALAPDRFKIWANRGHGCGDNLSPRPQICLNRKLTQCPEAYGLELRSTCRILLLLYYWTLILGRGIFKINHDVIGRSNDQESIDRSSLVEDKSWHDHVVDWFVVDRSIISRIMCLFIGTPRAKFNYRY